MPDNARSESGGQKAPKKHTAGAFDIRNIIGALLLIYGVLLVIASFFPSSSGDARTGGVNANLWTGLALLAAGAIFMVWARARPILVPEGQAEAEADGPPAH